MSRTGRKEKLSKWRQTCKSMIGLTYALMAALAYASSGLIIKFLDTAGAGETLLLRYTMQYMLMLPFYTKRRAVFKEGTEGGVLFMLGTALFCAISVSSFYFSVTMLPLGDATATYAVHVVLVGIVARIFLKEELRLSTVVFSVVSMVGLVFVSRPTFIFGDQSGGSMQDANRTVGIILAATSALLTSGTLVAIRKFTVTVHISAFLFYYSICGLATSTFSVAVTNGFVVPCLFDILIMFLSSCAALGTAVCKTMALKYERPGPVTIVTTSQVIFAFLFDYLFRGFVPPVFSLVGAGLILLSCVSVTAFNIYRTKSHRPASYHAAEETAQPTNES